MSRLNEADLAMRPVKRTEHPVDAVAGIAKDMTDAPLLQTLHEEITDRLCHGTAQWEEGSPPGKNRGAPVPFQLTGRRQREFAGSPIKRLGVVFGSGSRETRGAFRFRAIPEANGSSLKRFHFDGSISIIRHCRAMNLANQSSRAHGGATSSRRMTPVEIFSTSR
jgi:hypothetical protein